MDSWVHKNSTGKHPGDVALGFATCKLCYWACMSLCRTCIHLKGCICQHVFANELPTQGSLENILLLRAPSMALALLCTCTRLPITFSQIPLHLQSLSCSCCPSALPQGEQGGWHPWGINPFPHHATSQAGEFQSEESGRRSPAHSHPASQEPAEDKIKLLHIFVFSTTAEGEIACWKCPRFPQEHFLVGALCRWNGSWR